MHRIALSLLAAALVAPATASAGLVLGAGTGLVKPLGSIGGDDEMKDAVSVMIPAELQLGWKFADRLTLAGFLAMDFGFVGGAFKDSCDASGDACLVDQARLGLQARWNFQPSRQLDPWVGLGFAQETLAMERSSDSSGSTTNVKGLALDVMAGADYWVSDRFSVRPWLGLSVGKYTDSKELNAIDTEWKAIPEQKLHALVTAGVRVAWDFGGRAVTDTAATRGRTPSRGDGSARAGGT
jgi:outer membrane protein W